jgi:hypothetical protein
MRDAPAAIPAAAVLNRGDNAVPERFQQYSFLDP